MAYMIAFPLRLASILDVFNVSTFRRYMNDHSHVIEYTPLELGEDLRYEEQPIQILAQEVQEL